MTRSKTSEPKSRIEINAEMMEHNGVKPVRTANKKHVLKFPQRRRSNGPNIHVDESERFGEMDIVNVETDSTLNTPKADKNCRCSRTKCLKQYCLCFRRDLRCSEDCTCVGCLNDGEHERERIIAVRHVRLNSSTPFKGSNLENDNHLMSSPGGTGRGHRGCGCKKSRCQKKVTFISSLHFSP